jgi:nucleotide-binding universal stress UspA family protein
MNVRQILVPTDFSTHSARALETAIALAKTFRAKIHLLHAYHMPAFVGVPDEVVIPPAFWATVRDAAARKLEKSAESVAAAGVNVETHLAERVAAEAIVEAAAELGIDLVVMGTRGLTGLKHVVLGSVAERTLRLAPCPVLAVKAEG